MSTNINSNDTTLNLKEPVQMIIATGADVTHVNVLPDGDDVTG